MARATPLARAEVVEAPEGGLITDGGRHFFGEPFPDADAWLKMRASITDSDAGNHDVRQRRCHRIGRGVEKWSGSFWRNGAGLFSPDFEGMVGVLTAPPPAPADFYKSMTTTADHRIGQDVYRPRTSVGEVYLKLTVIDDVFIVSFKEP